MYFASVCHNPTRPRSIINMRSGSVSSALAASNVGGGLYGSNAPESSPPTFGIGLLGSAIDPSCVSVGPRPPGDDVDPPESGFLVTTLSSNSSIPGIINPPPGGFGGVAAFFAPGIPPFAPGCPGVPPNVGSALGSMEYPMEITRPRRRTPSTATAARRVARDTTRDTHADPRARPTIAPRAPGARESPPSAAATGARIKSFIVINIVVTASSDALASRVSNQRTA
mmetsp:Transcript_1563/g.5667  ORF Transcript_1563/g.5667 Transcript_1563/m.5667 type:complete len:226 (-) Transcript_1563:90-767(-)